MHFEPKTLFPGLLFESADRVAKDISGRHSEPPSSSIIAEMGWSAVLIPEAQGGVGGDFSELGSIIESLAMHAVALPVIARCGIVPSMLKALSDSETMRAFLAQMADGSMVVELGGPLCSTEPTQPLTACRGSQIWSVSGATTELTLTDDCTHVLLVCRTEPDGAPMLALLGSETLRRSATRCLTMDDRQVAVCRLDNVPLPPESILATGTHAEIAIHAGWCAAMLCMAIDTVSCMGSALSSTIVYLLERQQFGQHLSQFQALRHEVARLYVSYELARNLLRSSMRSINAMPGKEYCDGLSLLGLFTGREAIQYAESVIQLHGGMGMTREMRAARLATRMIANAMRFGDPLAHQQSLNHLRDKVSA